MSGSGLVAHQLKIGPSNHPTAYKSKNQQQQNSVSNMTQPNFNHNSKLIFLEWLIGIGSEQNMYKTQSFSYHNPISGKQNRKSSFNNIVAQ